MKKWLIGCVLALSSQVTLAENTRIEVMTPVGNYMDFVRSELVPEFKKRYPEVDVVVSNDDNLETRMAAGDVPKPLCRGIWLPACQIRQNGQACLP